ncbi:MAG: DUF5693 family protein [Veillonellaceae bacterium]|nr:DUF5693 family protein [Veillonellaceae bacterium]
MNDLRRVRLGFLVAIVIGLCAALSISFSRIDAENSNRSVEMVYDYGRLWALAPVEEKTIDEALDLFRKAGVTSFALYDETPEALLRQGYVQIENGLVASAGRFAGATGLPTDGIYLAATDKAEAPAFFAELVEDLRLRLPADSLTMYTGENGRQIVRVAGVDYDAFLEMPTGISAVRIRLLEEKGFGVVVRPTNYAVASEAKIRHFLQRIAGGDVRGVMFVGQEALGYPDEHRALAQVLAAKKIPVIVIEAPSQLQFENQQGALEMLEAADYYGARAYSMHRDELVKLSAEEASQRYFISDIERNIRLNFLASYKRPLPGQTILASDADYIGRTTHKLQERGYETGKPGVMQALPDKPAAQAFVLLGIAGLFGGMLQALTGRPRPAVGGAVFFAVCGTAALFTPYEVLARQVAALTAAIATPTVTMDLAIAAWRSRRFRQATSRLQLGLAAAGLLLLIGAASLGGGWLLGSILADTRFLLELEIFRGVKLAFIAPVICMVILYLRNYPTLLAVPVDSAAQWYTFARRAFALPVRLGMLLLLGFVALAGLVLVGRSGHTEGVPVSGLEIAFRRYLEGALAARPRMKELLIGHPVFFLVPFALRYAWPQWLHMLLVIAAGIGQASMVETFAHLRSPLWMSTVRGLNGLALGLCIGVLAAFGAYALTVLAHWGKPNDEAE